MEKIIKIVCLILNILAWAVFVLGLIRLLVAWNTLPDEIGIHFTSDGNFDARRSKLLAFYPYIISLLALAFFGICGFFEREELFMSGGRRGWGNPWILLLDYGA